MNAHSRTWPHLLTSAKKTLLSHEFCNIRGAKGEVEMSFSGKAISSSREVIKREHASSLNETIKNMRGLVWL